MKKIIAAAAAAILITGLTACTGGEVLTASLQENADGKGASLCGMNIDFPKDWEVLTGDRIYEKLFENSSEGYSTVEELKASYTDSGMCYLLYAVSPEQTAMVTVTALKIVPDENTGEQLTIDEYARVYHDNSLFSLQASGLGIKNAVFSEKTIGGRSGWLSAYEVYPDTESEEMLMGQSEFFFEYSGNFCSLQTYYYTAEAGELTDGIIAGITSAE